jgi:NAD(P)-dependent dehydrogenase (short-subunit alcohol dehydrogenase family)
MAEGARVVICGRRDKVLQETVSQMRQSGGQVLGISADVTQRHLIEKMVTQVVEAWGTIDILINNAGISGRTPLDDPDDSRWMDIIQVNLIGTYLCSKLVLPHMKGKGYGRIINLSSVLGRFGVPGYTAYCTAKHGILGFTKALALEVAESGITVNAICPTWVDTPMARQGIRETSEALGMKAQEFEAQALAHIPIKRMAEIEEVSALVLFYVHQLQRPLLVKLLMCAAGELRVLPHRQAIFRLTLLGLVCISSFLDLGNPADYTP